MRSNWFDLKAATLPRDGRMTEVVRKQRREAGLATSPPLLLRTATERADLGVGARVLAEAPVRLDLRDLRFRSISNPWRGFV
jgi:hypothetical protein